MSKRNDAALLGEYPIASLRPSRLASVALPQSYMPGTVARATLATCLETYLSEAIEVTAAIEHHPAHRAPSLVSKGEMPSSTVLPRHYGDRQPLSPARDCAAVQRPAQLHSVLEQQLSRLRTQWRPKL